MKEYNYHTSNIEYHPADTPDFFLCKDLLDEGLKIVTNIADTEKDHDTIDFIRKHEESQIQVASGKLNRKKQHEIIENFAKKFRDKHGDWVHHANRLYDHFYEEILILAKRYK